MPRASQYVGSLAHYRGAQERPDALRFYFTKADGSSDSYTGIELREGTWWYCLCEDIALSIDFRCSVASTCNTSRALTTRPAGS